MSRISDQRRQEILMAACQEFQEHSVKSVSMSDIAQRAQIGKSTIYEYFSSKDDLIRQAGLWLLNNHLRQIEAVFSDDLPLQEQLCHYLDAFPFQPFEPAGGCLVIENLIQFIRIFGEESLQEEVILFQKRIHDLLTQSIRTAARRGELPAETDASTAAQLMSALLNPMCIIQLKRSGLEDAAKQAAQVILAGLSPTNRSSEK